MRLPLFLPVVLMSLIVVEQSQGFRFRNRKLLKQTNAKLHGQVVDLTANHGEDNRIWSDALCQKRDMYVYLPPGFDPKKQYPLMIWLHGFAQDEVSFLQYVAPPIDARIAKGTFPPTIIVAPDGTFDGHACLTNGGSFYLNSKAGKYEDYLMKEVWDFVHKNFPIRPEREAHAIAGASMGGHAAYNKGIKYRKCIKHVLGIYPPLNTRWISCRGRYRDNFSPETWSWRTDFSSRFEVVGRFYLILTFRLGQITRRLYGNDELTTSRIIQENPIEMLDKYNLRPGELEMYVAYGGRDEFNIDAQIESFLYHAKKRGLHLKVVYDPKGRHDLDTARRFIPSALAWLAERLAPYSPCLSESSP